MPGDCVDANTFSLPNHEQENLSTEQCAERMADHFAAISQDFPKIEDENLPTRVKNKLKSNENHLKAVTMRLMRK